MVRGANELLFNHGVQHGFYSSVDGNAYLTVILCLHVRYLPGYMYYVMFNTQQE